MWLILFLGGFLPLCVFAGVMLREPRTLMSGVSFFFMMLGFGACALFILLRYSQWLAMHEAFIWLLIVLAVPVVLCVVALPGILIVMFFVEGIRIIRREGRKPSNLLSLLFSFLLFVYVAVWPRIGNLAAHTIGTMLYAFLSLMAFYLLALLAMYVLSALLNLIHLRKKRRADYIVVLGAGVLGTRVTPLLAARINRGIELLSSNPNAMLVMSGGQGPGEELPEGEAMARYAREQGVDEDKIIIERKSVSTQENLRFSRELMHGKKPRILVVTTSYHVFRALLLAKEEGIKCVGFGSKTKWYFTLNALIREFAGYLHLTWKKHARLAIALGGLMVVITFLVWL